MELCLEERSTQLRGLPNSMRYDLYRGEEVGINRFDKRMIWKR